MHFSYVTTLRVSQVSRITFVRNVADFSIGVRMGSALYVLTRISDEVLESITSCLSNDNYKASSAPCTFNSVDLTLFSLGIWVSSFCSAEIDQLKKLQAAKPIENKLEEIPRPKKIMSLQDAMGLTKNKQLYFHCRE
jgi:hypothetical protein